MPTPKQRDIVLGMEQIVGFQIHKKKRRTPRREVVNIGNSVDSTNSETDIQDGEGFG